LALPINHAFDPDNNLSMNRSDLIYRLAELHPQLLAKDVDLAVKVVLDAMSDALSHGGRIEIRGFGSFGLNYRPPRQGRNPKTGEIVNIPAKYMPHFKMGKELRERVLLAACK
jgi:integration host factor subunit beta